MTRTVMATSLLLAAGSARAQEAPAPPVEVPTVPEVEVPELPTAAAVTRGEKPLPWRFTAFEDLPGSPDCDPESALRGQCFEEVRFVAPPAPTDDRAALARWRSLAAQEAMLWEGLAYRWAVPDDVIATSIVAAGYDTLPTPADAWEAARGNRGSVSAPEPDAWLPEAAWTGPADSFFPLVRYKIEGERAPGLVLLRGRFAERLGAKGRPHDFDLMDANPVSSAPFFEQMHPFASFDQAGMRRPLDEFDLPAFTGVVDPEKLSEDLRARVALVRLDADSYDELSESAAARFDRFSDLLSVQVAQFALEDFTPNHMRVFTALSAMVWPPGPSSESGGSRRLVAAARGETDAASDIAARADRSSFVLRTGFLLELEALSVDVVADWVAVFHEESPLDAAQLREIQVAFARDQGANVRPDAPPLTDPRREAMTEWATVAAGYGVDPALVVADGQRFVLRRILGGQPETTRQENAARILLDQLRRSAASVLDDTPGARAAPQEVVGKVSAQWASQLGRHGFAPRPMAQPYGGIDPTAICTTVDGPAALAEASYGAVDLDVLVRADDRRPADLGADAPLPDDVTKAVLWEARNQLPFLLVDDPRHVPEGTRLAGLPGDKALYRIRWRVWTGWHLFWVDEALGEGARRLAVRTGAVCADTVLTSPELVPTLARAALLADTFRPTSPVPFRPGQKHDPTLVAPPSAHVEYLRGLALAPLHGLAEDLGGFLLVAAEADEGSALFDLLPPTPYARDVRRGGGAAVRTAEWARFFASGAAEVEAPLVYPAFRPGQSVGSDSLHPRWNRVPVTDFTFTAGLGAFPWRRVDLRCGGLTGSEGFVAPCEEADGLAARTYSEGLAVDAAALTTFWALDQPRIGLEAGLEVRMDVSHEGNSWVEPDTEPAFTWMFRPAGGLLVGVRAAPAPGPLTGGRGGMGLWGADRVDGSSRLGRVEGGLRGGFLVAPGYNGAEGTFVGELWIGASARRGRSPLANLTPYNPRANYGLFLRGMYATTLVPGETTRRYELDESTAILAGIRGTWDLQVQLPEAPKVE